MSDQPTALRLADVARLSRHDEWHRQADAELRRLYDVLGKSQALNRIREARIKELEEALEEIIDYVQNTAVCDADEEVAADARAAIAKAGGA